MEENIRRKTGEKLGSTRGYAVIVLEVVDVFIYFTLLFQSSTLRY